MARLDPFVMPAVEGWINILGNHWRFTDVRHRTDTSFSSTVFVKHVQHTFSHRVFYLGHLNEIGTSRKYRGP